MIVIIDNNYNKSYHTKRNTKAADFIGVHRNTISNWLKGNSKSQKYNHLDVYLDSEEL